MFKDIWTFTDIYKRLRIRKMAAVAKRQNMHALFGMAKDTFYQEKTEHLSEK